MAPKLRTSVDTASIVFRIDVTVVFPLPVPEGGELTARAGLNAETTVVPSMNQTEEVEDS